MYIMLDQSGSMDDMVGNGGTKWQSVTGALTTFVQQPNLDGVSVGLGYFGTPVGGACSVFSCTVDADCGQTACGPCDVIGGVGICQGFITSGGGSDSCAAADYAIPAVEIAPLPGVGSAITTSMGAHSPSTNTPTSAALQGAVDHAGAWATSHPGEVAIAVLATDGDPTECDTTLADINQIAATAAAGTPKIPTYVIGVGSDTSNLNGIAVAGGTGSAFLVDTGGNVNAQFLDAMNAIRGTALGCVYQIPTPSSGSIDFSSVDVVYQPGGGGPSQTFPNVGTKAMCPMTGDGWYYNDPSNPTQIILCDATCSAITTDTNGEIDISLPCGSVVF